MRPALVALALLSLSACAATPVPYTSTAPRIDGDPGDAGWALAPWREIRHVMLGEIPSPTDFSGRYKLLWDDRYLYLLAEITDDVLVDAHADPLTQYWDDDALEIFVDENASGGLHQFDHSAFAYHIGLDNQAADIGPFLSEADRAAGRINFITLPAHVHSRWQRSGTAPFAVFWEVRIGLFRPQIDNAAVLAPVMPHAGKEIGFMLAYCDADDANGRQHFVGDTLIEPVDGDRNRGYIDAGVFGRIVLESP